MPEAKQSVLSAKDFKFEFTPLGGSLLKLQLNADDEKLGSMGQDLDPIKVNLRNQKE